MTERLLYKPCDVAEIISTSKTTVYDLIAKGQLATVRVGTDLRVPASALNEFIAKQLGKRSR